MIYRFGIFEFDAAKAELRRRVCWSEFRINRYGC
jgi:hypothetical protein